MLVIILRGVAAVIAALILAFAGVIGVELMSSILHPFPPGTDQTSLEVCKRQVASYPTGVLLLCTVGWWLTVLASSWVGTRLGANRHPIHGMIVGTILLALAIFNMVMLPYPSWFWINVLMFPVCCGMGIWWGRGVSRPT